MLAHKIARDWVRNFDVGPKLDNLYNKEKRYLCLS